MCFIIYSINISKYIKIEVLVYRMLRDKNRKLYPIGRIKNDRIFSIYIS